MSTKKRPLLTLYAVLIFLFLYIPFLALGIKSFENAPTPFAWYVKAFQDELLITSLTNSILIGTITTLLASILGTLAALSLRKKQFPGKKTFELILNLPLVLPEIVLGLALLIWFTILHVTLGYTSIILAHTTFTLSYVVLMILARLQSLDPLLEEAAADLGANRFQIFSKVTLPLIFPSILGGALLSFTLSFDDFLITFFTSGVGSDTLPLRIYSLLRFGITPEMNAISFAVIAFTFLSVLISVRLRVLK